MGQAGRCCVHAAERVQAAEKRSNSKKVQNKVITGRKAAVAGQKEAAEGCMSEQRSCAYAGYTCCHVALQACETSTSQCVCVCPSHLVLSCSCFLPSSTAAGRPCFLLLSTLPTHHCPSLQMQEGRQGREIREWRKKRGWMSQSLSAGSVAWGSYGGRGERETEACVVGNQIYIEGGWAKSVCKAVEGMLGRQQNRWQANVVGAGGEAWHGSAWERR